MCPAALMFVISFSFVVHVFFVVGFVFSLFFSLLVRGSFVSHVFSFFLIFVLIVSHFSHCCLIFLVWRFHRVIRRGIFLI